MNKKEIAELILRRRLQILVHSCLYYEFDTSLVTDATWASWAKELTKLQSDFPDIASNVKWADEYVDFDPSTGYNLPVRDPWVTRKARQLMLWNGRYKEEKTNERI